MRRRAWFRSVGLVLLAATSAQAADFHVTKIEDTADGACDADCSLREAVLAANALPGPDRIVVPAGVYSMEIANPDGDEEDLGLSGDLDVLDDLEIAGAGAEFGTGTEIQGMASTLVRDADRAIEIVGPGVRATMRDLRFSSSLFNQGAPEGGCVLVRDADLVLERVAFESCHAAAFHPSDTPVGGGAIALRGGSIAAEDTRFNLNTAVPEGGGVLVERGTAALRRCEFFFQEDAIVAKAGTRVAVSQSTFDNSDVASGAGEFVLENVEMTNSPVRILAGGRALIRHGTLAIAGEAAIVSEAPGEPRVANSIVRAFAGAAPVCDGGPAASLGYNVVGDLSCFSLGEGDVLDAIDPLAAAQEIVPPDRCAAEDLAGETRAGFCDAGARETADCCDGFVVNSTEDRADANPADLVCDTGALVGPPGEEAPECTLRAAVETVNAYADAGVPLASPTIAVPAGEYTLTIDGTGDDAATGDLDLETDVTIRGAGAAGTTIRTKFFPPAVFYGRIFDVHAGPVVLADLTLTRGDEGIAQEGGGALRVGPAEVTLVRVRVRECRAAGVGGAIQLVANSGGSLRTVDTEFADNRALPAFGPSFGGAVLVPAGTSARFERTTFAGNRADHGGAVAVDGGTPVGFANATLSGNRADLGGGALYVDGAARLEFTTVAGNVDTLGGAHEIRAEPGAAVAVVASIVWRAGDGVCGGDPLASEGYNLGPAACGLDDPTDRPDLDPDLAPLGDYGGPTRTRALQAAGPAVDLVPEALCPPTDQRGTFRPQDADDAEPALCDAGAFEAIFLDNDGDDDGVLDDADNCLNLANPDQADLDGDQLGDPCDNDMDGDGSPQTNCGTGRQPRCDCAPTDRNMPRTEVDGNGVDDDCDGTVDEYEFRDCNSPPAETVPGTASGATGTAAPLGTLLAALVALRASAGHRPKDASVRPTHSAAEKDAP